MNLNKFSAKFIVVNLTNFTVFILVNSLDCFIMKKLFTQTSLFFLKFSTIVLNLHGKTCDNFTLIVNIFRCKLLKVLRILFIIYCLLSNERMQLILLIKLVRPIKFYRILFRKLWRVLFISSTFSRLICSLIFHE